jgi:hypothetical protein
MADMLGSGEYLARVGGSGNSWIDGTYEQLLGRAADPAGETYWLGQLASGQTKTLVALDLAASTMYSWQVSRSAKCLTASNNVCDTVEAVRMSNFTSEGGGSGCGVRLEVQPSRGRRRAESGQRPTRGRSPQSAVRRPAAETRAARRQARVPWGLTGFNSAWPAHQRPTSPPPRCPVD